MTTKSQKDCIQETHTVIDLIRAHGLLAETTSERGVGRYVSINIHYILIIVKLEISQIGGWALMRAWAVMRSTMVQ